MKSEYTFTSPTLLLMNTLLKLKGFKVGVIDVPNRTNLCFLKKIG